MPARDDILARIRGALADAPATAADPARSVEPRVVPSVDGDALVERFVDRLIDYKAAVTRCAAEDLSTAIGAALLGVEILVVPEDLPSGWLGQYAKKVLRDKEHDRAELTAAGAVLTGCALAIAETGTIVLDAGAAQGRRALSLIPDHHVCVVRADQVLADVGDAVARLVPTRPLTWISGPSATSDIELDRVEGVHGPRRLHVIIPA
jgi:L-lactate dehydrogenase complex protein LldG